MSRRRSHPNRPKSDDAVGSPKPRSRRTRRQRTSRAGSGWLALGWQTARRVLVWPKALGMACRRHWRLVAILALIGAAVGWWGYLRPGRQFEAEILEASRRYGVDPALIKAVIWQESRFNPVAVGAAGEVGLMQVTDPAAQEWASAAGVYPLPREHLFNPRTNILAGAWYLKRSLNRHPQADDPLPFGLAEYNAGRGNVLKWARGPAATNSAAFVANIGFPSTQQYVRHVLARRLNYLPDFPAALANSQAR